MRRRGVIIFFLLCTLAFLHACIAVEEEISIKLDGSGSTRIIYKVAKVMYTNLREGEVASVYPITPEGIKKAVSQSADLELKDVDTKTQGNLVIIKADIKFKRFNALTQPGTLYELREGNDYYEARITIRNTKKRETQPKREGGLSQEQIDKIMLESLKEYRNKLVIYTPTPIIDSNADYWSGREAKWEIPSAVFYKGGEDIVVWVRYKKKPSLWDRIRDIFR